MSVASVLALAQATAIVLLSIGVGWVVIWWLFLSKVEFLRELLGLQGQKKKKRPMRRRRFSTVAAGAAAGAPGDAAGPALGADDAAVDAADEADDVFADVDAHDAVADDGKAGKAD